MQNLFQKDSVQGILDRLEHLQQSSHPLWGKMNASQMLAHCAIHLQVALGDSQLNRTFLGWIFGRTVKKKMINKEPFKKNLPSVPRFIIKDQRNFEIEKQQLQSLIRRFESADSVAMAENSHPFFGKMSAEEWSLLSYKHLDHHLRQFGH
jgi:hypothetical protein